MTSSHRYLFDEHPHFFYPTLAERLGLNEAIVIQQIHSWIQTYLKDPDRYREKHYHDGAWWTWDSYPDWHKKLPYLSESTIRRALTNLRELGILKVGNYNTLKIDRTYWYTIDYEVYDKLWSDQDTNLASSSVQNEQMEDTNLDRPLPDSSALPSPPDSSAGEGGATAPTPAEPPTQEVDPPFQEKEPEKKKPHEAISIYRREFHSYPYKQTWPDIVSAVGDEPERLGLWARVCHQWRMKGYYKYNLLDLIDCYHKGGVKTRGNSRHDGQQGGSIEDFLDIAAELRAEERAGVH